MATPLVAPLTPVNSKAVGKMETGQGHKAVMEATKDEPCPMPLTFKANSDVQSPLPDVAGISSNTLRGESLEEVVGRYPDDSDSEEEEKLVAKTPTHSERKRIQDALFKSYVSTRAAQTTKEEVQAVLKNANEEILSVRGLIAKQDSSVIITDPREYQLELFEKAKKQNIIAVLDTGSGKTLIAVDCVTLVFQQARVLECNLDQKIDRFCGEMGCDLWTRETWHNIFADNMVIVCTAEILYQCLMHSFISMNEINLLIFDEAHHTKKNHSYARIIKDFYIPLRDSAKRPKVFGMTASPVDARVDVVRAAKELETLLHSQIVTASDLSLLRHSISRPNESLGIYKTLIRPYDTPLCSGLKAGFSELKSLSKIFAFARDATSQLGEWCADQVWQDALAEEESLKAERKLERIFLRDQENRPMELLDKELVRLREVKDIVRQWKFGPPTIEGNNLSPKVLLLHQYLALTFEKPTDAKCIIFVKRRKTARLLSKLLSQIGSSHMRPDLLIGSNIGDYGDVKISFRQQVITLMKFRKGEVNCLIATSIAEEGLDIPDCNLIIRFDLYDTLIQYIQSRGRARHANSKYLHMVEENNKVHFQAVNDVRSGEQEMRKFCEALPADRLLQGNEAELETALLKEKAERKYTDPETGATLTYASSLVVLAHFVSCLPHGSDTTQQVVYTMSVENKQFVCEVILPENSPLHSATGTPASRKSIAKRSAAFEACIILRKKGYLDKHLLSTYHKQLPHMRNALLALNTRKSNEYKMRIKPKLWAQTRGSRPERLYMTVLQLETPENLGRSCQPLALLTRTRLPELPAFPLYLYADKTSNVLCKSLPGSFEVDVPIMIELTEFTHRIYNDIFNKIYEVNEAVMSYWLAPVVPGWMRYITKQDPKMLIDWTTVKFVHQNQEEFIWTPDTPHDKLLDRFVVDRFLGSRRFYSEAVETTLRPRDPIPEGSVRNKNKKFRKDILDHSVSLWSKSRKSQVFHEDQPVMRMYQIPTRRNFLDRMTEDDKKDDQKDQTTCYVCPEPLRFSALPISVVSMAYLFPSIIHRLESYLITLEACDLLGLSIKPELALEAMTKDSDNTEEHKAEQIHLQRGMGKNYERLEFIGDCFLKMATSIPLFSSNPDDSEFEFHVNRMVMICNKNLLKTALDLKIYEYIRTKGFLRRTWNPQGMKQVAGKDWNKPLEETDKHHLGDKSVADVCEALIGAALLSPNKPGEVANMDMAVQAVSTLVSNEHHNVTRWADYYPLYKKPKYQLAQATASQFDLAMQVEKIHDYHFKYPRLLRSAFIHPSYTFAAEKIPCYQRLEFLGDSLLDMASINFLFHRHPDKDPQWLTEHKMAMVSNKFLAALSVKLGFHKHLRSSTAVIEHQNREYIAELEEAEREAKGARDYWMSTKQPPKNLSDIAEAYIGAVFVDSEFKYKEVERFFDAHIRWFFEDMFIYDTFANNHPTTYLHKLMELSFGCTNYRLMASEIPAIVPGGPVTSIAVVMIHNQIICEGQASSGKNAKVKASQNALKLVKGIPSREFKHRYRCDCEGNTKQWVGQDGDGIGMVGTAI